MEKALKCNVIKIQDGKETHCDMPLVHEYALTIYLNKNKLATMFCTPEKLKELTIGFLRTQQLIENFEDITYLNLDESKGIVEVETKNKVFSMEKIHSKKIHLESNKEEVLEEESGFLESLDCEPVESNVIISVDKIHELMERNLSYSKVFRETGGAHTISITDSQDIILIAEDVARHNAVDKVIGEAVIKNIYLKDKIVIISGRVSLEMILKAAQMQMPIVIAKSAPTSLSVALAKKLNITLVGFVRDNKMNIYANENRIKL